MEQVRAIVRIHRRSDGAVADVSDMMDGSDGGRPVIHRAVNRAGDFSFALTVGSSNPILDSFDGWKDGSGGPADAGAVTWGMYCTVTDAASGALMADGIISTLRMQERVLQVECADWLAVLGSQGGDIRRNFYADSVVRDTDARWEEDAIRSTFADDEVPMTETAQFAVYSPVEHARSNYSHLIYYGRYDSPGPRTVTWAIDSTGLSQIRRILNLQLRYTQMTGTPKVEADVTAVLNGVSRTQHISLHGNMGTAEGSISFDFGSVDVTGGATLSITAAISDPHSTMIGLYVYEGENPLSGDSVDGSSACLSCRLDAYTWKQADVSVAGQDLVISSIDGVSSIDESLLQPDASGRVRCTYSTGEIQTGEIMRQIGERLGFSSTVMQISSDNDPKVAQFNTGGGYALDYLTLVADITDKEGRGRSFCAVGNPPVLNIGSRRLSSDSPQHRTVYGCVDTSDPDICDVIMYAYSPTLTMKNRPSRAVYRGERSNPGGENRGYMILVVSDPKLLNSRGLYTDTLISSSGVSDIGSAAAAAWSEISKDPEEWEGELTLSGIVPSMIDSSGQFAGSGIVIEVTHPLSGQTKKRFAVTEVVYDYNQVTTKLTLTNHSMRYASSIPDTVALAVQTSAQVANGNEALSRTQFVSVKTDDVASLSDAILVEGFTSEGTVIFEDITRLDFPSGRTVIYAMAPASGGTGYSDNEPYDVSAITLNGVRFEISELERPDYKHGQTLIVNIDIPTP